MMFSKKLTAGLVSACMTFGSVLTGFAALPSDSVGSVYAEAIETLGALSIMTGDDDGSFRPDATIRRSEFAKVAVETLGLGSLAKASMHKTIFPDVVENHWANGYINVATSQGIIVGDDEGNFRPDDSISYAEAMTILVRMLGYEPMAEKKGGFPNGYISVGTQNGLSKKASAAADDDVIRGMVAQMTFNALTVKMMEQTGYGSNEKFEVVDKTLLYDMLGVTKAEGQINAISISSISGTSSLKDNQVRIDDKVYTVSESALASIRNLLGFNVTYYLQENQRGDKIIILARANENENNATTVLAGNVEDAYTNDKGNIVLEYWKDKENDKRTEELVINADAQMIFNGKATTFDIALLSPESGRVTCLDIDGDEMADIVFVTSLYNLVVENVLTKSHKVTDKYGNPSLVLDPEDTDVKFTITRSGQVISLADLSEWDVLSIAKSNDGAIISVEVSTTKITGKVTEVDGEYRRIDGKEYEIAKNYKEDIKLGDEGTFYLDAEGKIAAVDTVGTLSSNYAYAVNAALGTGFDKTFTIKLFTKDEKTAIYKSTEKVRLNGTSKDAAQVFSALTEEDGSFIPQLITFEVNSDGEITQINTAIDLTDSGTINKNKFALNATGEMMYKKASNKLGAFNINENTLILSLPKDAEDSEEYSVENIDFFEDKESYNVSVYDAGEDFTAKVVIVTNASSTANLSSSIAIVDQIASAVGEDGEPVQKLYVYKDGQRLSFDAVDQSVLEKEDGSTLKRGDIVQLKLNAKQEISGLRLLFESDKKDTEFKTTIEDLDLIYGRVIKKFASSMNVQVAEGEIANFSLQDVTVYEYDSSKKKNPIRVVDAGEITQYDESDESRVFIKVYKDTVEEIVIVK